MITLTSIALGLALRNFSISSNVQSVWTQSLTAISPAAGMYIAGIALNKQWEGITGVPSAIRI